MAHFAENRFFRNVQQKTVLSSTSGHVRFSEWAGTLWASGSQRRRQRHCPTVPMIDRPTQGQNPSIPESQISESVRR